MQDIARFASNREKIAATVRLVMVAGNRQAGEMAIKQGADAAMADDQNIAVPIIAQNGTHFSDDALLRIDCPLPATHASAGLGKKPVRHPFEFLWLQETRRAAVVLMHGLPDFRLETKRIGQNGGRFDRLGLTAANNPSARTQRSGVTCRKRPLTAKLGQAPFRHRTIGYDLDLRVAEITQQGHRTGKHLAGFISEHKLVSSSGMTGVIRTYNFFPRDCHGCGLVLASF